MSISQQTCSAELEVSRAVFSPAVCKKIARRAVPAAITKCDDRNWLHPLSYGTLNYQGRYTRQQLPTPAYLTPIINQLDEEFPPDLTETTVLRVRTYRTGYHFEGGHLDSTCDLRKIAVIAGSGWFVYRPQLSTPSSAIEEPVSTGDVITLDNTDPALKLFHHAVPNPDIALLIYGKAAPTET